MKRTLPLIAALGLGLVGPALAAQEHLVPGDKAARHFPEGTPVVIVGRISSQPRNATFSHEHKMQVSVGQGATDYTLHLKDARIIGPNGHEAKISDLQDRWWVRAQGRVMDDPRRIEVTTLRVFSKTRDNLKGSPYYRSGMAHGYVTAVAGSRQTYRHR